MENRFKLLEEDVIISKVLEELKQNPNIALGFYLDRLTEDCNNLSVKKKKKALEFLELAKNSIFDILKNTQEQLNKL